MKKLLLCGTTLLALSGAPALAADLPRKAPPPPPPPPVYTWSGFYIGVHGGWGSADVDTVFNDIGFFNDCHRCDGFSRSADGALFGGHLGFNWQFFGNWLFGFEVAGTWSDINKTITPFPLVFPDHRFDAELNWLFTFTPRLGITAGNWLFYVKGGLAVADVSVTFSTPDLFPFSFESSETRSGWTVGGGFEVMTGSTWPFGSGGTWVFGVEGNYYDFGTVDFFSQEIINTHHDVTMWSVLGRLSWKFGGAAPVAARY